MLSIGLLLAIGCSDSHARSHGEEPQGPTNRDGGSADEPALEACNEQDFCWVHGVPIADVHGASDEVVFAVGAKGTLLEWTGDRFVAREPFTEGDLNRVWVAAANDVWIIDYAGEVFHYDGRDATKVAVRGRHVSGSGPDNLWIDTQRFDGNAFEDLTPPGWLEARDVLALDRDDVWALGYMSESGETVAMHYDGERWEQRGAPLGRDFFNGGQLARVRGEIWAFVPHKAVRFDGAQWIELPSILDEGRWQLPELAATGNADVLLAGGDFIAVPIEVGCKHAFATDTGVAWCSSNDGHVAHFDGGDWRSARPDRFGATLDAEQWGRVPPELFAGNAKLAWGTGPSDVFRVRPLPPFGRREMPGEVLEHYDGTDWTPLVRDQFYRDLSGSAAADVWIVGSELRRYDGQRVETIALPAELGALTPKAVLGFGPRAAWVLADRTGETAGVLLRYDGRWSVAVDSTQLGDGFHLDDVAGRAADDVWLLASSGSSTRVPGPGALLHFDGSSWSRTDLWTSFSFRELETDGKLIWFTNMDGTYELAVDAVLDAPRPIAEPSSLLPLRPNQLHSARLWVTPDALWFSNAFHAILKPR
jgi:hypothetical protein